MFPQKENNMKNTQMRRSSEQNRKKSHFQLGSRVRSNRILHPEDEDDGGDDNDDSEGS